jgi:tRNA(Ile)-lysidine synthase
MLLFTEKKVAIQTACKSANQVFVAFSGGVDSHVLLHLCASTAALNNKLTAVYVHHGLQKQADYWAKHCKEIARQLSVSFCMLSVDARQRPGESPEETARNLRHQALQSLLGENDVLLLGQHREDQLETLLLQLFRGAGLPGLAAMPEKISLGKGLLLRPMLDISQKDIKAYAAEHKLSWIEDPSNFENDFDRNYLRNKIIPLIKNRWPAADKTVFRSAKHCAQAEQFISRQAESLFPAVYNDQEGTLSIAGLQKLSDYEQTLVIRMWLYKTGKKNPSEQLIRQITQELMLSRQDGNPQLQWQHYTIRRYQDKLYCLPNVSAIDYGETLTWPPDLTILHLPNNGFVQITPSSSGIDAELWRKSAQKEVRYRQGGESIRLPGREGRHQFKKLFQEAAIPPWKRENVPLLFLDDKLAVIGNYWISAEFYSEQKEMACLNFQWLQPELQKNYLKGDDEDSIVD